MRFFFLSELTLHTCDMFKHNMYIQKCVSHEYEYSVRTCVTYIHVNVLCPNVCSQENMMSCVRNSDINENL